MRPENQLEEKKTEMGCSFCCDCCCPADFVTSVF